MDPWKIFTLAGAVVGATPVTPNPPAPPPPNESTTWHCIASSPDNAISADIEVDVHGKGEHGEFQWTSNVGDVFRIRATVFGDFSKDNPEDLRGHMLFLEPDLLDKSAHDALYGHKFRWVISTHPDSGDQYPNWHSGIPAFAGKLFKFNGRSAGHEELELDPDDFFALTRGSDQLFLLALDKNDRILLRRRFLLGTLRTWAISVQKYSRQAVYLTPDYLKSCERDDHDQIVV